MCAIWLLLSKLGFDTKSFEAFNKNKMRGPDYSEIVSVNLVDDYLKTLTLGFHRLAIMDPSMNGSQPFENVEGSHTVYAMCNGEIYNYKQLVEKYDLTLKSECDCEVLPYLYKKLGFESMLKELRGEFAICVVDHDKDTNQYDFYFGRDNVGVRPLYYGIHDDFLCLSSELKGIPNLDSATCDQFPPGHYVTFTHRADHDKLKEVLTGKKLEFQCYWDIEKYADEDYEDFIEDETEALDLIRNTFIESVICRLDSDRPLGALLSGGLDSSLVCAVAAWYLKKTGKVLRTFSIGMKGSTDEYYARRVAKQIGSEHIHITLTDKDFINAIDEVIATIESFDTTTIRASTGQYLISKYIAEHYDIKVLLIGDGSDELCSGYMYFHNAPDPWTSHLENINLVKWIHRYDGQRADRCISGNGLESRVPFLDKEFIDLYLRIHPKLRVPREHNGERREKYLLRKAFDGWLDDETLWRPKEAFSDGVSSMKKSWYEYIQDMAEEMYTDEELAVAQTTYSHLVPRTKEELYFRKRFEHHYSKNVENVVPYFWMPKWCGDVIDPSARVLNVYSQKDNSKSTEKIIVRKKTSDKTLHK